MDNSDNDPQNTPEPASSFVVEDNQQQEFIALPAPLPSPKKSNKKKLLFAGLGIILIIAAVAAWFLVNKRSDSASQTTATRNTATQAPTAHSPYNLVYTTSTKTGQTPKNCGELEQTKVFYKPSLSAAQAATGISLNPGAYVAMHETMGNKVAIATGLSCGATGDTGVWYSADAGKTYAKVFTYQPAKDATDDAVTSMKFSGDGNSLLIAYLPGGTDRKNTIKKVDLATRSVKDVVSTDTAGVFIYGYDAKAQNIYFSEGCFQCDGNGPDPILAYNPTDKTTNTFYKNPTGIGDAIAFNNDFTKALYVSGTEGSGGLGAGPPYTIVEIDARTKQTQTVATVADYIGSIGYRTDDNVAYYADGSNVYQFVDGASTSAFKASSTIQSILSYSKDKAVVTVANGYDTYEYDLPSKSEIKQLHVDNVGQVIGIAWN